MLQHHHRTSARAALGAVWMLTIALALGGCPSSGSPVGRPSERVTPSQEETSTPLDHAVDIEQPGVLVHAASNLRFPERAAGFVRRESKRYDREGHDLGIGYTRAWRTAVAEVTIYVYPRVVDRDDMSQEDPESHLDQVIDHIHPEYDDIEAIQRVGGQTSLRGTPVTFASAELEHRGGPALFGRRVASLSTVVAAQSFWIKVRVTTPVENRTVGLAAVEELLAELDLPPTGLPPTNE